MSFHWDLYSLWEALTGKPRENLNPGGTKHYVAVVLSSTMDRPIGTAFPSMLCSISSHWRSSLPCWGSCMKKTDVAALSSKQKQKCLSYVVAQTSFASLPGQLLMRLTNQLWQKHRYTEDESDNWSLGCLGPWGLRCHLAQSPSLSRAGQTTRTLSHTSIPQSIGRLLPSWPNTP